MSSPVTKTQRSPNLNQDLKFKLCILTLHNDGRSRGYISQNLGTTLHQ
ncbi:hypothetical protein OnM2_039067, partial [Erysiphe neolycopersici]